MPPLESPIEGLRVSAQLDLQQALARALPAARPQTLGAMREMARVRSVAVEETVFHQGEPVPLTLNLAGYGAFRRTTIDGQELIFGVAEPGGLYGFGAISETKSPAALTALTEVEVALWRGSQVRPLVAGDPGFALNVIEALAGFLAVITEKVDGYLHQDARRRVLRILARHRDLFFGDPPILSRSHLPGLVGTSREMTGRVLRELEREGTVSRVGRTGLGLLRPDRLDAIVGRPQPIR